MAPAETHVDAPASSPQLREALRGAASALKQNGPRFALAGSYALWAYGAPEPTHDVDLVVAESDVDHAVATLRDAGFGVERPPEDWLFKARTGDTVIDVLHRLNGVRVESATLDCAEQHDVLAIRMPVLPPTMVLIQQLRALGEHHCDFAKLLPAARAVREQLDWERVRQCTADNDYAVAFLVLADRLGLTAQ
ncbi:nucleotidyltransferase family protein [Mycobacterium sp. SMC-2]|uniref:nucleotidyltransferase family protein n=1 Tax=Mycobacterium sp. SMC-2 TaxID=2857058 RepID=UPI0021B42CE6|nr:nucleotidyltransferase family protein [Mycobacterium sp. SMC-2]UXA08392.1 nucleotidyltransferase family protein [Mycobacterium sp. SMC-2]